jgi:hypothetical protein
MWLRRFCGVDSSGFERDGERTVDSEVDEMFGVGEEPDTGLLALLNWGSSWICEVPRRDPVLVTDRSLEDVDGSGVVLR